VLPDSATELRREDLLRGEDATLAAAVKWIEQQTFGK
jgi:hypothetical protein